MSELIKADNEYKEWIAGISTDFRKSQIRASMKINDEMLRFYWKLGKGISSMSEQFGYGMGFYKTVSDDLKSILPDVKSFSPTNLKYMRYFYEMYPDAVICPQVEDELITDAKEILQSHLMDALIEKVNNFLMELSTGFYLLNIVNMMHK